MSEISGRRMAYRNAVRAAFYENKVNSLKMTINPFEPDEEFYLLLANGYTRYDANGNCVAKYRFKGNVEELYKLIDGILLKKNESSYIALQFDCIDQDLKILEESVLTVLELEKVVSDAVHGFNVACGTDDVGGKNLPSFIKFCSTYLHNRFPKGYIPFDLKTYGRGERLFHVGKCNFNGYIVEEETKIELFNVFKQVYDCICKNLKTECGNVRNIYIDYCAKTYALCRYIKRDMKIEDVDIISLAVEIFKNIESVV